jgi:hypothetical protein
MAGTENEWDNLKHMNKAKTASEMQVGGDHYQRLPIQPIDFALANNLGFLESNVVKYVTRHRDKGGAEDIKKAIHYCNFILEKIYGENK